MRTFLTLFVILAFSLIVLGQDSQSKDKSKIITKQTTQFQGESYSRKPKLTLQDAMKLMEKYIEKEKIDTS